MVIQMADFQAHPEGVVREVLDFVGASQRHYTHRPPPKPAMQVRARLFTAAARLLRWVVGSGPLHGDATLPPQNNYKARTLHATCAAKLQQLYHGSNVRLQVRSSVTKAAAAHVLSPTAHLPPPPPLSLLLLSGKRMEKPSPQNAPSHPTARPHTQAMLHKPLPWMAPSADDVEHGRAPLRP